jgi:hypothetical protein
VSVNPTLYLCRPLHSRQIFTALEKTAKHLRGGGLPVAHAIPAATVHG